MKFATAVVSAISLLTVAVSASPLTESTSFATPVRARASSADIAEYLKDHNDLRAKHGAVALVWNNTLANAAQSWVNKCVFQHSGGSVGPYGENIAAGTGAYSIDNAVIGGWASEESQYNPSNPQYSHYTQMVWKSTKQLGCAVAACAAGTIFPANYGTTQFYACEYYPPGNVIGQFPQNVQ